MKNILAILFLLVVSTFTLAQTQPKTVTDFYLALPEKPSAITGISNNYEGDAFAFTSSGKSSKAAIDKHRKSLIKIADLKNGYLRLEGMWEGWTEIVLFKKADETYLVAISEVGCGPGCSGNIVFLTYNKGKWTDVTKEVFPFEFSPSEQGYYKLPRVGTTIELNAGEDCGDDKVCEQQQKLAEFKWNKTRFVK